MYRCKRCGAEVVELVVPKLLIKMGICPTCYAQKYGISPKSPNLNGRL